MNSNLVVIGIGSSAGGLEALQKMLSLLSNIDNCAYNSYSTFKPNL